MATLLSMAHACLALLVVLLADRITFLNAIVVLAGFTKMDHHASSVQAIVNCALQGEAASS